MTNDIKVMYTAIQHKPRDSNARLGLADALEEDGQALNAASHRIIAYPDLTLYREQLADLHLSRGEPKRARFIRACIELSQLPMKDENDEYPGDEVHIIRLQQEIKDAIMQYGSIWRTGPQCPTCSIPPGPNVTCLYCGGAIDGGGLTTLRRSSAAVYVYPVSYTDIGNPGCKTVTVPSLKDLYVHTELPARGKEILHHYVPSELLLRFCRHPDVIEIRVGNATPHWSGAAYAWYDMDRHMKSGATPPHSEIPGPLMRWFNSIVGSPERMAIYEKVTEATQDLSRALVRWATSMW